MTKTGAAAIIAALAITTTPAHAAPKPVKYKNCSLLTKVYPNGVSKTNGTKKVYALNTHLDRDKDGWACEKN